MATIWPALAPVHLRRRRAAAHPRADGLPRLGRDRHQNQAGADRRRQPGGDGRRRAGAALRPRQADPGHAGPQPRHRRAERPGRLPPGAGTGGCRRTVSHRNEPVFRLGRASLRIGGETAAARLPTGSISRKSCGRSSSSSATTCFRARPAGPSSRLAYPLLDEARNVRHVLVAGLDLAWLARTLDKTPVPADTNLVVVDGKGTVLAPEKWLGKSIADHPVFQRVAGSADQLHSRRRASTASSASSSPGPCKARPAATSMSGRR